MWKGDGIYLIPITLLLVTVYEFSGLASSVKIFGSTSTVESLGSNPSKEFSESTSPTEIIASISPTTKFSDSSEEKEAEDAEVITDSSLTTRLPETEEREGETEIKIVDVFPVIHPEPPTVTADSHLENEGSLPPATSSENDEGVIDKEIKVVDVFTVPPSLIPTGLPTPTSTEETTTSPTTPDLNVTDPTTDKPEETSEIATTTPAPVTESPVTESQICFNKDSVLCNGSLASFTKCIPKVYLCDNIKDCPDGEDENAEKCCPESWFWCDNVATCLNELKVCDNNKDCRDGDDETIKVCVDKKIPKAILKCNFGLSKCEGVPCNLNMTTCNITTDTEDCKGNVPIISNFNDTFVYYNEVSISEKDSPVVELTICMWINPSKLWDCDILHVLTSNWSTVFKLKIKNEILYAEVTDNDQGRIEVVALNLYNWHHLCVQHGRNNFSIYSDKTAKSTNTFAKPLNQTTGLRLLIGDIRRKVSFSGELADIRFYWEILTQIEMDRVKSFQEVNSVSMCKRTLFSFPIYNEIEKKNDSWRFKIDTDSSVYVMSFDEDVTCEAADEICQKFGGELPTKENSDDILPYIEKYFRKINQIQIKTFCVKMSSHPLSYMTGKKENNITIFVNSTDLLKPLCVFARKPEYHFRCRDGVRIPFIYKPHSTYEFKHPKENMIISWNLNRNGSKWIFYTENKYHGELRVENLTSLIGRREWIISNYHSNTSELAVFSTCLEDQFTCSSGTCVDLNKICNFKDDCPDESDEDFCKVGIEPLHTYDKRLAPTNKTEISLEITLNRIVEIEMVENIITLNLKLSLKWRDKRLRFKNLPMNRSMLVISEISSKYWSPRIDVTGAIDDEQEELFSVNINHGKVEAHRTTVGKPSFRNGYEVILHDGSDVEICHEKTDTVKIHCSFDLKRYPYDDQKCSFILTLQKIIHDDTKWENVTCLFRHFKKPDLPLYDVKELKLLRRSDTEVEVILTFKRKHGASLLTSFLPCSVLEVIGMLTLLLPTNTDYLNNRVILNLSCLIVMAAFFIQVNANLPASPYPKLIDQWMFFHICLQALVFIVHIIVIRLHHMYYKNYDKYWNNRKFGPLEEIRLPRVGAIEESIFTFQNTRRKQEKKLVKYYAVVNNIGMIVCASVYITYVTLFFLEISGNDLKSETGQNFIYCIQNKPNLTESEAHTYFCRTR